jgi:2,5-diketo-D-gluconate reductase B
MASKITTTATVKIPTVGLGTYQLTGNDGIKSIEDALQIGYRHIDTAQSYGNEEEVGKAIKNSGVNRNDIFITTKVMPADFKRLTTTVENSLKKLQTDYADLILLHWPSDDEANKKGLELLNNVLQKGYTKSIGVSNFNVDQLSKAVEQAPVICNQVEYHPYLSQKAMLAYLKEHSMFLTAYSPLAIGKVFKDVKLQAIAEKYKKSISQIVLRWLVQQEDIVVIPKASTKERRIDNLNIFDFELSTEDMNTIFKSKKARLVDPAWAPKWDN